MQSLSRWSKYGTGASKLPELMDLPKTASKDDIIDFANLRTEIKGTKLDRKGLNKRLLLINNYNDKISKISELNSPLRPAPTPPKAILAQTLADEFTTTIFNNFKNNINDLLYTASKDETEDAEKTLTQRINHDIYLEVYHSLNRDEKNFNYNFSKKLKEKLTKGLTDIVLKDINVEIDFELDSKSSSSEDQQNGGKKLNVKTRRQRKNRKMRKTKNKW